jgi:ATP-dependent DNA ligase
LAAKRIDSRYETGRRTGACRKIESWQQIELIVGGFVRGEDGGPASLLLGEPGAEGLRWARVAKLGLFDELRRALPGGASAA